MTRKITMITLEELSILIARKISKKEKNSYSYQLTKEGMEKITRKIGEEALEVVIAAFINEKQKSKKTRQDLIGEVCDLFYHSLVLLASQQIEFSEISKELGKRNKKK
ncbi:MAG: phosphoribosyl-ATP diphosphatase [Alphaproteobacteria bacterium]|nr:phosphoribosyl-ATP diphosphatase [Alphaproteobacteria bacterium]